MDKQKKLRVSAAAVSDKGCQRSNNEDNFDFNGTVMPLARMDAGAFLKSRTPLERDQLYAVCDGMGGEEAGELASFNAVSVLKKAVPFSEEARETIKALTLEANKAVFQAAQERRISSGSTMVCAAIQNGQVTVANVGDSRAYRLREGELVQLSYDHSEAQQLVDHGFVTKDEARYLTQSHTVTRYFGVDPEEFAVEATFAETFEAQEGDMLLLCSDGLTDMLSDEEICRTLDPKQSAAENAKQLVEKAKKAGGKDNITLILLQIEGKRTLGDWLHGR